MYKIEVAVNKEYTTEVEKFLKEKSIHYERIVRKGLDFPLVFMILSLTLNVVMLIYDFYREKRSKNENIQINMTVNGVGINLVEIHPEQIDKKIKEIEDRLKKLEE